MKRGEEEEEEEGKIRGGGREGRLFLQIHGLYIVHTFIKGTQD